MRISFTGTRKGTTRQQFENIRRLVEILGMTEAHHGDANGADCEFAGLANELLPPGKVIVHPPSNTKERAFCAMPGNIVRPEKNYFARNRDIVNEGEVTIGAPPTNEEQKSGGTFYTLAHSKKVGHPTIICWPDGRVTVERPELLPADVVEHLSR